MASTRDPFPYIRLENDDKFQGTNCTMKEPYSMPAHLAQKEDPWNRLNGTCTLSSSRREVYHFDPKAPNDSLDFILKADYNQHKEFLKGKNETVVQEETLDKPHGRILKNKTIFVKPDKFPNNHPIRAAEEIKKENVHNLKGLVIEGHHTQTTNRGFTRKPDGGFFTS